MKTHILEWNDLLLEKHMVIEETSWKTHVLAPSTTAQGLESEVCPSLPLTSVCLQACYPAHYGGGRRLEHMIQHADKVL